MLREPSFEEVHGVHTANIASANKKHNKATIDGFGKVLGVSLPEIDATMNCNGLFGGLSNEFPNGLSSHLSDEFRAMSKRAIN